jgi:hypothetical protein
VQHLKTPKPATARHGEPVSNSERLGSPLGRSNNPKPAELQAPDDAGESDLAFFTKRPSVNERIRLPIANEFPDELLKPGAFVHVVLVRDPITNAPRTRARAIFYSDIDGGRA